MQFELHLTRTGQGRLLTWNYQYPLSAAIYKIISKADSAYAEFLHDHGYGSGHQSFKLFTFSDLRTTFDKDVSGMRLQSDEARLRLAFHIPKAAEAFIRGLFIQQVLELADKKTKVCFEVSQVIGIPTTSSDSFDKAGEVHLRLLSPVVAGRKNDHGNYAFLDPLSDDFFSCLLYNWKNKYSSIYGEEEADKVFSSVRLQLRLSRQMPVSRLVTIKEGTAAETKIRGYSNFGLTCFAPGTALELLLNSGVGLYNAQGMGCVEISNEL